MANGGGTAYFRSKKAVLAGSSPNPKTAFREENSLEFNGLVYLT
jgi:hypothetical protein